MNALAIGCLAVTALLWGGALVLVASLPASARAAGITARMRWRQVRPDVWTLGTVGALFGLCGFALWGIG